MYFRDSETGYCESADDIAEHEHEEAEEARLLAELEAAHSPESGNWPMGIPDYYRELAIAMAREEAREYGSRKDAA